MSRSPDRTHRAPDAESLTDLGQPPPSPDMAVQCRNPPQDRLTHFPPSFLATSTAASRYLHPVQDPRGSVSTDPAHYFSSRQRQPSLPTPHQDLATSSGSPPPPPPPRPSNNNPSPEPEHLGPFQRPQSRKRSAFFAASPGSQQRQRQHHHGAGGDAAAGRAEEELELEPARKSCKLVDTDGWIEKVFAEASLMRRFIGEPDPDPLPVLTTTPPPPPPPPPSSLPGHLSPLYLPRRSSVQQHQHHHYLLHRSPSDFARSPDLHSEALSRPSQSPVPSQATVASMSRRGGGGGGGGHGNGGAFSPPETGGVVSGYGGTGLSGFSDRSLSTRANSATLVDLDAGGDVDDDDDDAGATFDQVHNVPRVVLPPREPVGLSRLEQLPREIFMRVMMYCGYKEQVLLKQCSYRLYNTVDLEAIPWEKKTETILCEERYNPYNFPKKPPKTIDDEDVEGEDDDGGDAGSDEDAGPSKGSRKRRAPGGSRSSHPQRTQGKAKAHPDTLGRWGCYYCYKILPAYHFEGQLLEDKEGRKAKNHSSRGGAAAAESDKKVDMRVAYVQVLRSEPGRELPRWLTRDTLDVDVDATAGVEAYVRARMARGVRCDDLRAYYRDITRETHLVAPLRGVNPVFIPSPEAIPPADQSAPQLPNALRSHSASSSTTKTTSLAPCPEKPSSSSPRDVPSDSRPLYRPLYKLPTKNAMRGDADGASYTYEITIPNNPKRETRIPELPQTPPVGRVCLPQGPRRHCSSSSSSSPGEDDNDDDDDDDVQEPTILAAGDVVSLRRVCIPCGTKYAVYRRDCNRKIISKTEEAWWVCDCPQVRLANRSTGCPTCKRKVIY